MIYLASTKQPKDYTDHTNDYISGLYKSANESTDLPEPIQYQQPQQEHGIWDNLKAGGGSLLSTAGGLAEWAGATDIGNSMQDIGNKYFEDNASQRTTPFSASEIVDPNSQFYKGLAQSVVPMIPVVASSILTEGATLPYLLGGRALSSLSALEKAKVLAQAGLASGAVGGTVMSGESAGSMFNKVKAEELANPNAPKDSYGNTMYYDKASDSASKDFQYQLPVNMALSAFQTALPFTRAESMIGNMAKQYPISTGLAKTALAGGAGGLQGAGMVYADDMAQGKKFDLGSDETKEAIAGGAVLGGALHGILSAVNHYATTGDPSKIASEYDNMDSASVAKTFKTNSQYFDADKLEGYQAQLKLARNYEDSTHIMRTALSENPEATAKAVQGKIDADQAHTEKVRIDAENQVRYNEFQNQEDGNIKPVNHMMIEDPTTVPYDQSNPALLGEGQGTLGDRQRLNEQAGHFADQRAKFNDPVEPINAGSGQDILPENNLPVVRPESQPAIIPPVGSDFVHIGDPKTVTETTRPVKTNSLSTDLVTNHEMIGTPHTEGQGVLVGSPIDSKGHLRFDGDAIQLGQKYNLGIPKSEKAFTGFMKVLQQKLINDGVHSVHFNDGKSWIVDPAKADAGQFKGKVEKPPTQEFRPEQKPPVVKADPIVKPEQRTVFEKENPFRNGDKVNDPKGTKLTITDDSRPDQVKVKREDGRGYWIKRDVLKREESAKTAIVPKIESVKPIEKEVIPEVKAETPKRSFTVDKDGHVYNEEAGQKKISQVDLSPEHKTVVKLGKALGTDVTFYHNDNKQDHGYYFKGKAYINRNSEMNTHWVLGHEWAHHMIENDPAMFKKLSKTLGIDMKQALHYQEESGRRELGFHDSEQEIVANEVGNSFMKPDFWDKLHRRNPGLFTELINHVRNFFKDVMSKLKGERPENQRFTKTLTEVQAETVMRRFNKIASDVLSGETKLTGNYTNPEVKYVKKSITSSAKKFLKDDVSPSALAFKEAILEAGRDTQRLVAPATVNKKTSDTRGVISHKLSTNEHRMDVARELNKTGKEYFATLSNTENLAIIDSIENGTKHSDPMIEKYIANMRTSLDEARDRVQALGKNKLANFIENYFPHIWERPDTDAKEFMSKWLSKNPMEGQAGFLKKRSIPTTAEGIAQGLKPVSYNPVELSLLKLHEMNKYITAHETMNELKQRGLVKDIKVGENQPDGWIKIDDKIATKYAPLFKPSTVVDGVRIKGDVKGYQKLTVSYAPREVADLINNHLSAGLRGKSKAFRGYLGLANTLNQFQLGMSAFHAGFTSVDSIVSRVSLGLYKMSKGDIGAGFKDVLSSPLAFITNPLKGNDVIKEWNKAGAGHDPILGQIVEALQAGGARVKMDDFYKTDAWQGMKKAFKDGNTVGGVARIPFAVMDQLGKPIMEHLVPRQKLGIFYDLAKYELEKNPILSQDPVKLRETMGKIWNSVDNRMGQMVYDNLFWNKTLKDVLMAGTRSVGWNLGTWRELGGGAVDLTQAVAKGLKNKSKPELSYRASYTLALPMTLALMGATYQYMATGKSPESAKDLFFPRNGQLDPKGVEQRVSLPSYIKDIYAMKNDPVKTVSNKLHPALGLIAEMLHNKDYYGKAIANEDDPFVKRFTDRVAFVAGGFIPFSVKNSQQSDSDAPLIQKVLGFTGVVNAPSDINKSVAEKKMSEIMQAKTSSEPKTAESMAKSDAKTSIARAFAKKDPKAQEMLDKGLSDGVISHSDAKKLKNTKDIPIISRSVKEHLSLPEALKVYKLGTPEEQAELNPIMRTKIENFMRTASKNDKDAVKDDIAKFVQISKTGRLKGVS